MAIAGNKQRNWSAVARYAAVIAVCLVFIMPFVFMISNSLKSAAQIMLRPRDLFALPLHLVMSFLLVSILPIVAVFLAAQRYFIEGVSHTGLKA